MIKKWMAVMISLAVLLAFSACGIQPGPAPAPFETADVQETPVPKETEEPVDPLLALWSESAPHTSTDEAIVMSNTMNCSLNLVDGDRFFGCFYQKGSRLPQIVSMRLAEDENGIQTEDAVVLDSDALPNYLFLEDQSLVYLRLDQHSETWSIATSRVNDGTRNSILEANEADYLSVRNGRLLFTDENRYPVSMSLNDGDREALLSRQVAFPYLLGEDWLIYQNLEDRGSLYLTHLPSGTDVALSDRVGAYPVLDGDILYFATPDEEQENAWHLCRIDLSDWSLQKNDNSSFLLFKTEVSDKCIGCGNGVFYLDADMIYGVNGSAVSKDQWNCLENDGYLELREQYSFVDESCRVMYRQNEDGVTEINITAAVDSLSTVIPWL